MFSRDSIDRLERTLTRIEDQSTQRVLRELLNRELDLNRRLAAIESKPADNGGAQKKVAES